MKKTRLFVVAFAVMAIMTACSNADVPVAKSYDQLIIGQWVSHIQDEDIESIDTITFNIDKTLLLSGSFSIFRDSVTDTEFNSSSAGWRINGDTLFVIWHKSNPNNEEVPYRIDKLDNDSLRFCDDLRPHISNGVLFSGKKLK